MKEFNYILNDITFDSTELLKLMGTDMSYKQIAHKKNVKLSQIARMRDILMIKSGCKTRTAVVIWGLKNKLIKLSDIDYIC